MLFLEDMNNMPSSFNSIYHSHVRKNVTVYSRTLVMQENLKCSLMDLCVTVSMNSIVLYRCAVKLCAFLRLFQILAVPLLDLGVL